MIRPRQQRILQSLATYKWLQPSQMLKTGCATHKQNLYPSLNALRERGFCDRVKANVLGRQDVWYLKNKGATWCEDNLLLDWIHYVKRAPRPISDLTYEHRARTVDSVIDLYGEKEWSSLEYEAFIEYGEGRLQADCLMGDGTTLYSIEMHHAPKRQHILDKIRKYNKALAIGNPSRQYGYNRNTKVLHVFSDRATMGFVKTTMEDEPQYHPFNKLHRFRLYGSSEWIGFV